MKQIIVLLVSCVLLFSCVRKEQVVPEKEKSDWLKVYPLEETKEGSKPVYNDKDEEVDPDSWYGQGYIDSDNSNTFIVNEHIKVVGKPYSGQIGQIGGGDVIYVVLVDGKEYPDIWTIHSSNESVQDVVDHLESLYIQHTVGNSKREPFKF